MHLCSRKSFFQKQGSVTPSDRVLNSTRSWTGGIPSHIREISLTHIIQINNGLNTAGRGIFRILHKDILKACSYMERLSNLLFVPSPSIPSAHYGIHDLSWARYIYRGLPDAVSIAPTLRKCYRQYCNRQCAHANSTGSQLQIPDGRQTGYNSALQDGLLSRRELLFVLKNAYCRYHF